jgi:hypothetical protein
MNVKKNARKHVIMTLFGLLFQNVQFKNNSLKTLFFRNVIRRLVQSHISPLKFKTHPFCLRFVNVDFQIGLRTLNNHGSKSSYLKY